MLGSDCMEVLAEENEVIALERKELNITRWDNVTEKLHAIRPDVILNCAAFTDVDACEKDVHLARKVNVEGTRNLAQGSARYHCTLVHISSDYVFNGEKGIPQPYFEDDPLEPLSVYGRSKLESEIAVRENAPDYLILRSGWLYGIHGKNFITAIVKAGLNKKREKLRVVEDQYGSPTWTYRLALQIRELIKAGAKGTYHATAEGYCTRFEWARLVIGVLKLKAPVVPCATSAYPRPAKRPMNCILENRLLKKQGVNVMVDWKQDVEKFLEEYGDRLIKEAKAGGG